ncbi:DRAP deaminase [Kwoniella mangroviensis CBS 10435]|uniref:DRAP deaminase n=1 Tax=Kwoniella mangroviensis CBS 10435 TaxID=1331196 RepID=A0A1B9J3G4_9TREE|nr:DRAP deaminase [Kwoniella mangroviensis CBS 10435]
MSSTTPSSQVPLPDRLHQLKIQESDENEIDRPSGTSTPGAEVGVVLGRSSHPKGMNPKLRYIKPYWWPYKTHVKQRWIGRQILEVITTEFRDRSMEYYRHALESGVTRVNGVTARPDLVLRDGDRIDNTVHRHEPPITNDPILVLHIDRKKEFVVISKPGSAPVHATGRYFRHSVLEMMESDYGIKCYSVNRLDRLTSGLMILALSGKAASRLATEFAQGKVEKEYVARVKGKFPEEEVTVDQPLLTVDRQMGLVIITPEGKDAVTIFKRISYDAERDQSVVRCRPQTGRTHQIRVHLQYLGHPIANDPLYSTSEVWGQDLGKGGVNLTPAAAGTSRMAALQARVGSAAPIKKTVDRDHDDIDLTSPILLSEQARSIISKLRRQKDEAEDWIKWKEVIFTAKQAQDELEGSQTQSQPTSTSSTDPSDGEIKSSDPHAPSPLKAPAYLPPGFCGECFVPLPDDPDPETLFIYLHALRYTTPDLGTWETPLPRWAGENWDGDWRGWCDGAVIEDILQEDKERQRQKEQRKGTLD